MSENQIKISTRFLYIHFTLSSCQIKNLHFHENNDIFKAVQMYLQDLIGILVSSNLTRPGRVTTFWQASGSSQARNSTGRVKKNGQLWYISLNISVLSFNSRSHFNTSSPVLLSILLFVNILFHFVHIGGPRGGQGTMAPPWPPPS